MWSQWMGGCGAYKDLAGRSNFFLPPFPNVLYVWINADTREMDNGCRPKKSSSCHLFRLQVISSSERCKEWGEQKSNKVNSGNCPSIGSVAM